MVGRQVGAERARRLTLAAFYAAEISLGADRRRGLAAGKLVLLYHPQVNAHSAVMTGVEALVRWQHRDRGLLTPAAFLAVAENGPLIVDLTYLVLDAAIGQGSQWPSPPWAAACVCTWSPKASRTKPPDG